MERPASSLTIPLCISPRHFRLTDSSTDRRTRRNWRPFRAGSPATESPSPVVASSSSNRPAVICLRSWSAASRCSRGTGGRAQGATVGLNRADARTAAGTESPQEPSSYARPVRFQDGGVRESEGAAGARALAAGVFDTIEAGTAGTRMGKRLSHPFARPPRPVNPPAPALRSRIVLGDTLHAA